jgi:hypothetical protein
MSLNFSAYILLKGFPNSFNRMSYLSAFNNQLIRFFEELVGSYPEEKGIRMALEAIQGTKKINPKLILDLFYDNVYRDCHAWIEEENDDIISFAKSKISNEYNEMSAALFIFDKYWPEMSENNQKVIWQYLKVLCVLCEKAKGLPPKQSIAK